MTYTTVYNPFTGEAFSTILHYLKDVYGGKPPSRRRPRRRAVAVLAAGPSPYSPPSRRRPRRQEPHGIHAQNLPEGTLDQRSLCLLA